MENAVALCLERYDIFVLEAFVEVQASPEAIYNQLVEHVQSNMPPMKLVDAAWETDEHELRKEMLAIANQKSGLTMEQIRSMDISDWQPLLSEEEKKKYKVYLEKLEMADLPKHERPARAVVLSQDPESSFAMSGTEATLPAFTTDSTKRTMWTHLDRWLTSREKAALTGFPVHEEIRGPKTCI